MLILFLKLKPFINYELGFFLVIQFILFIFLFFYIILIHKLWKIQKLIRIYNNKYINKKVNKKVKKK